MTRLLSFFSYPEFLKNADVIDAVLITYFVSLLILFVFAAHGFVMLYHYRRNQGLAPVEPAMPNNVPPVTVQLPLFNELYVAERLIKAVCAFDYPKDKLEIQVLDDSTDETVELVRRLVARYKEDGFDISQVRRPDRQGFKAGALRYGLGLAKGEFIAIFDADFVPKADFLRRTIPHFNDLTVGMVQTRWEHINGDYSLLTRTQALALDGHFVMEQDVRNKAGYFINFNGTGGIWRASAILDAGNWQSDTLTEDLDLSYRAQLRGWRFIYLNDVTSPAELPAEVNALKSQQFRWTKGAIETARKILPKVWRSNLPFRVKVHSTFHLTNNLVFPFIILAGVLNVPLVFVKHQGGHQWYFAMMSVFVLAFIASFLFYLQAQKAVHADWRRRILLFPLFMAGSMGFAVNNSRAVLEGLFRKKSAFVRTPKYAIRGNKDRWEEKKYVGSSINWVVLIEVALALYCFFGVVSSLYHLELAAVPFQLLYVLGFSTVSWLSIRHAFVGRRIRVKQKLQARVLEQVA